jgi:hypothetical protein
MPRPTSETDDDRLVAAAVLSAEYHLSRMPAPAWRGGPWKVVGLLAKALLIQTERLSHIGRTEETP